ncbi:MAG: hypothetical protein AAAB20_11840 [Rhizobium sp.]|uniref:hypothetical protein n=1 Tax=Rhizobium sp. TaxID=391 RepID=UPI000B14487B
MDKGLPNGKANWRCDRGEIHCCTHPVGVGDDRNLGRQDAEIKGMALPRQQ